MVTSSKPSRFMQMMVIRESYLCEVNIIMVLLKYFSKFRYQTANLLLVDLEN